MNNIETILNYIFINTPLLILWYFFSASPLDFILYYNVELILLCLFPILWLFGLGVKKNDTYLKITEHGLGAITVAFGSALFSLILIFTVTQNEHSVLDIINKTLLYFVIAGTTLIGTNKITSHPIHQKLQSSGDLVKWAFFLGLVIALYASFHDTLSSGQFLALLLALRIPFTLMGSIKMDSYS